MAGIKVINGRLFRGMGKMNNGEKTKGVKCFTFCIAKVLRFFSKKYFYINTIFICLQNLYGLFLTQFFMMVKDYGWFSTWQFRTIISVKVILFTMTAVANIRTTKTITFDEKSILTKFDDRFTIVLALWPPFFHVSHLVDMGMGNAELCTALLFLSHEMVSLVIIVQHGCILRAVIAVLKKVTSKMNSANLYSTVRKHTRLAELAQSVHDRFAIQLFFILIYSYFNCLIWGFYILKDIYNTNFMENFCFFIIRFIYFLSNMGITRRVVSTIMQFKEQNELFMNMLQKRLQETQTDKQWLCFYLRRQCCPEFKALSLLPLNNSLVTSVAATVFAYIIIMTQFNEEINLG